MVDSRTVLVCVRWDLAADQGEEGPQSGSVGGGGVELDSGGKHGRCMEAFKASHLAFSASSCAISISSSLVRCSISRTGRQFSIDKNCRHRGKDEKGSPLLLERESCTGDGDVVIGGKQGDQAEQQTTDGLNETEPIEAGPGTHGMDRFWRSRRWLAGRALGIGHGLGG
jgi:hypothetical protein